MCVSAGEIVIANRQQNTDLFWAAPGSGLGFFAVITRIWGRTIPAARLFKQTWVFDATDSYQEIAKWAVKMSQRVPRFGNEVVLATQYADKDEPQGDDNSTARRILLAVSHEILADRSDEAATLARPFSEAPTAFEKFLVFHQPLAEQEWEQSVIEQDKYVPTGDDLRWVVDSILTDNWSSQIDKAKAKGALKEIGIAKVRTSTSFSWLVSLISSSSSCLPWRAKSSTALSNPSAPRVSARTLLSLPSTPACGRSGSRMYVPLTLY